MIALILLLAQTVGGLPGQPLTEPHGLPQVREVMPGSTEVHENLLRFSIRLTEPTGDDILQHLSLVRADGSVIDEPFLNQELWSPDGTTLTVIFGPGRVKTGLTAHDTLGRPLHSGDHVTLQLDGRPLVHWSVLPEWIHAIKPKEWTVVPPARKTREPLRLHFPEPLDGMDADLIIVIQDGHATAGTATLDGTQSTWSFRPVRAWSPGRYTVLIHPHLEDPYGNEVGSAFETPGARSAHSETAPSVLSFDVR